MVARTTRLVSAAKQETRISFGSGSGMRIKV